MTAPCRCRDLRRSLLGLVRATTRARDAVLDAQSFLPDDTKWPEDTDFDALEKAHAEEQDSRDELCCTLRRARRLLRETRIGKQEQVEPDTFHSPTEALSRIMAAWQAFSDSTTAGGSLRAEESLWETLRSVARERGFGGEDGGAAK